MGMAASQARYLALVARKSNCEYEGQQINQARTVLSNQSANLFNQMLGLSVPVPPSTQDYTKMQYSFSDGSNEYTIDSWQQLATPEEDYNYVVTHHYYSDVYTGSQKLRNDPQVQFSTGTEASVEQIETALRLMTQRNQEYEEARAATAAAKEQAATLSNYVDNSAYTGINGSSYDAATDTYSFTMNNGGNASYVGYNQLMQDPDGNAAAIQQIQDAIQRLVDEGVLDKDITSSSDMADIYYNATDGTIAFQDDLKSLYGSSSGGINTNLPVYRAGTGAGTIDEIANNYDAQIAELEAAEFAALQAYQLAETAYESLSRPTYIGNCELNLLVDLTEDQKAELKQVVTDMKNQGIDASINDCFDEDGNYLGGVYSFQMNGVTYYTTFEDLNNSYASGSGINNIDGQNKLAYYNATYVSTKIEETKKALLETDGNGRFTSVRFEDDTITYTLNAETITDDAAYQDAMNQYYYESAQYDKMVQDINAKTSLIQQEDLQLELRLKQLDTEQNALSTEIDAVSKIVKDNIEDSFKTFSG